MEPIPHRADDPPTTPAPAAGPPVHATDLDAPAEPPAADDTAGTRRRGTTTPRTVTLTIPDPRTVLTAIGRWLAPPPQPGKGPGTGQGGPARPTGVGPWLVRQLSLPRLSGLAVTLALVVGLALTSLDPNGSTPTGQVLQPSTFTGAGQAPTAADPAQQGGAPLALAVTAPPPTTAPATTTTLQPPAAPPAAAPPAPLPATPVVGQSAAPKTLSGNGIPARAKTAYTAAATRMTTLAPGCRLPWTLLAAVGRIESDHGRAAGSTLVAGSGRAVPPIYGIRLDGTTPGTGTVRDTDHGSLDADPVYDRAVGPLQFLPATWRTHATDADNDGAANPQDIDDAALAAARYLCTPPAGTTTVPDLSNPTGQWNAAWRYNHSTNYANLVLALTTTYTTGKPATVVTPPAGATTTRPTLTITITPSPSPTPTATPTSTTTAATGTTSATATTTTVTQTPTSATTPTSGNTVTVTVTMVTVTVTGQPATTTTTAK